jgi:LysM repeat protein
MEDTMSRFKTSSTDRVKLPVILAGGAILAVVLFLIVMVSGGGDSGKALQEMRDRLDQMESRIAFLENRLEDRSRQLNAMSETLGVFSDNFDQFQALPTEMEAVKQKTDFLETRQANLERRFSQDGEPAEGQLAPQTASAGRTGKPEVKSPRITKTRPASAPKPAAGSAGGGSGAKTHTVKDGETLYSIAQRYDLSLPRLLELNNMEKDAIIRPGQDLNVGE